MGRAEYAVKTDLIAAGCTECTGGSASGAAPGTMICPGVGTAPGSPADAVAANLQSIPYSVSVTEEKQK